MKDLKFSIIIPVYNTDRYLPQCFNSVLKQTYTNFEVIIVNDGSTDNSLNTCKKYEDKDSRFKVISIKNQGVSVARNIGLLNSNGDYVTFLDSDDWIDSNALDKIYKIISTKNYDIIQSNLYINTPNKQSLYLEKQDDLVVLNKREILESIISIKYSLVKYDGKYLNCRCAGAKFYRRELLKENDISFPIGVKAFEDGIFNLQAYLKAKDIYIMKDAVYHYMQYDTSATGKYYLDQEQQNIAVLSEVKKIVDISRYELLPIYNYCVFELYYVWIDKIVRVNDIWNRKQKIAKMREIYNNPLYNEAIKNLDKENLTLIYKMVYILSKKEYFYLLYLMFKIKKIVKIVRR